MKTLDSCLATARASDSDSYVTGCREYDDLYLFSTIKKDGKARIGSVGVAVMKNSGDIKYPAPQFFVDRGPGKQIDISRLLSSDERRARSTIKQ